MATGRAGAAVALGVASGLGLAGASTGAWVVETVSTDLGGVERTEQIATAGVDLAGPTLPIGVAAVIAGLLLVVARGWLQRGVGVLLALLGAAGVIAAVVGIVRAAALPGEIGGSAWFGLVAAAGVGAAGFAALRPAPPPRLGARYDLDAEDPDEAEWRLASESPGHEPGLGRDDEPGLDDDAGERDT